jgi:Domain of unknown function (DUF929)
MQTGVDGPPRKVQRQAQLSGRAARRQREEAAARQKRVVWFAAAAIVVVLAALAILKLLTSSSDSPAANSPAPAELVAQVTGVDASIANQIGRGSATNLPVAARASIERGPNGVPLVTYIGAEYCPFCAAERWSIIAALGRFGTFSGLQLSHSATDDVYPNTATFSFVGSTYASQYVDFSTVELQSNVRAGNAYAPLQTPTPAQSSLLQKYDAPPYVPPQSAGSIPFIDLSGQYIVSGASFDVGILRGMSHDQIAASLNDPSSPLAQGIIGGANTLTAAICSATANSPADVCNQPAVQSLQATLAAQPTPG